MYFPYVFLKAAECFAETLSDLTKAPMKQAAVRKVATSEREAVAPAVQDALPVLCQAWDPKTTVTIRFRVILPTTVTVI